MHQLCKIAFIASKLHDVAVVVLFRLVLGLCVHAFSADIVVAVECVPVLD